MLIAAYWERLAESGRVRGGSARRDRMLGTWPAATLGAVLCGAGAALALAAIGLLGSAVFATSVSTACDRLWIERSFAPQVKARFPGQPVVYYGGTGLEVQWYLGPGALAGTPEQLAQMIDERGSAGLLVVWRTTGARCRDAIPGLRVEPLLEQSNPAVSRWVKVHRRFTLLRVMPPQAPGEQHARMPRDGYEA
jgi:hypothetical protein